MNRIAVAELTSEAFAPFGEVGAALAGSHTTGDIALQRGLVPLVFAT
jgi:ureidoglycolate hydrolase